jgi:hypothetical protein
LMSAAALWLTALLFVALLWRTLKRARLPQPVPPARA